ncbi:transposase [Robbsia betulipollinis]|uniref:transposase n=1 Tax=Robbsia betulipollinis TaxID=2981849 RepID=UPI003D7969E5
MPEAKPSALSGRPRVNDRTAFDEILFVLFAGIPWKALSTEPGVGSGMTCWRRLHEWHEADIWKR